MKNRRRIEITIFRRRTTIVLREKSEVGRREGHGDGETLDLVRDESARVVENDLDETRITEPLRRAVSALIREPDANDLNRLRK